jgi:hypothetical protein
MAKGWSLFACLLMVACLSMGCATAPVPPRISHVTVEEQVFLPADILTGIQVAGRDVRLIFELSDATWKTYTASEVTDLPRMIPESLSPSQGLPFLAKQNPTMGKLGLLGGAALANLEIQSKRK